MHKNDHQKRPICTFFDRHICTFWIALDKVPSHIVLIRSGIIIASGGQYPGS